ncbi:MAG: putative porin [Bacteroidota bacterium]|nr:putative porin [Bacteroidota bacterium]
MHKLLPYLFLLFSSLLPCLPAHALSLPDSLKKTKKDSTLVFWFNHNFEKSGNISLHPLDTVITGFQNYDPLFKKDHGYASLGNIGLASFDLTPYPFLNIHSGFDYGVHTFDPYLLKNDSVKYYRVLKTFSELEYVQGSKKEIFFHAKFSRNIYKTLNLGFEFRVMNSPGAYIRQRANHQNFVLTSQYFSKDYRYGVVANFLLNVIKNNENGGIKHDSLFEQNLEPNRELFEVNLNNAQNRIRENGFYMKHYFDLSRHPKNLKDTAYFSRKHFELGRITYAFEYNRQVFNYIDYEPKSGFYPDIFKDSTETYDSVTVNRIVNEISWSNPSFHADNTMRHLQLAAHFKQQYYEVREADRKNYFNQYIPSCEVSFIPYSTLNLTGYADYVFGDYNEGDHSVQASLSQILGGLKKNAGKLTVTAFYAFQKPGWFEEHYQGNNFRWDTAWRQQGILSLGGSYSYKNYFDAGFNLSRINHFVYFDSLAHPSQYGKEFAYLNIYLNEEINFWRFKLKSRLAYQTIQGANVIRVPAFLGTASLYFSQPLFKGAALFQPGLTFYYNTLYYGYSYMPAIHSFYLQDKRQIGNYLYMDVFINVKIQRARVFVMYSNFDSFFMGRKYYTTVGYPMQDASFRFGITWRFHD